MGLLDKIFNKPKDIRAPYFKSFTEYAPVFTSYNGSIYEQELTRAAIDRFATACSKLKPEIKGKSKPAIVRAMETVPNEFMTWPQFLSRLATILECDTTAYVVPSFAADGKTITGIFPLKVEFVEILEFQGEPWMRFTMANGDVMAIEYKYVCVLTKYQYQSDFFGSLNCIDNTMQLIHAQNEAQNAAIKNGAAIRFIGSLTGQVREEDMRKKRERFSADNLSSSNASGIILYDQTFSDVRQIEPQSYVVDVKEMERIEKNVYTYFGTNEKILQNDYNEDQWGAYYEGKVEPFAIQLGEGLTKMLFSPRERLTNQVMFSSNRLEYATNASKRNMIRDMLDRGVFTINQALNLLQMPEVPDGDIRIIRGEYLNADVLSKEVPKRETDVEQHDETHKDSDKHGTGDFDKQDFEKGE